ncbi:MAG: hypothetical protein GY810_05605 [Aureispira sp.]|nr:hypothetical protein [Aureispira sp.]
MATKVSPQELEKQLVTYTSELKKYEKHFLANDGKIDSDEQEYLDSIYELIGRVQVKLSDIQNKKKEEPQEFDFSDDLQIPKVFQKGLDQVLATIENMELTFQKYEEHNKLTEKVAKSIINKINKVRAALDKLKATYQNSNETTKADCDAEIEYRHTVLKELEHEVLKAVKTQEKKKEKNKKKVHKEDGKKEDKKEEEKEEPKEVTTIKEWDLSPKDKKDKKEKGEDENKEVDKEKKEGEEEKKRKDTLEVGLTEDGSPVVTAKTELTNGTTGSATFSADQISALVEKKWDFKAGPVTAQIPIIAGVLAIEFGVGFEFEAGIGISADYKPKKGQATIEATGNVSATGKATASVILGELFDVTGEGALKATASSSAKVDNKQNIELNGISGDITFEFAVSYGLRQKYVDMIKEFNSYVGMISEDITTINTSYLRDSKNLASLSLVHFESATYKNGKLSDPVFTPGPEVKKAFAKLAELYRWAEEKISYVTDILDKIKNGIIEVHEAAVDATAKGMKATTDYIEEKTGIDVETKIVDTYDSVNSTLSDVGDGLQDLYNELDLDGFELNMNHGISKAYDYGDDIHMALNCKFKDGNKHDIKIVSKLYFKNHLIDTTRREDSDIGGYGSYLKNYPLWLRKDNSDAGKAIKKLLKKYSKEELEKTKWVIKSTVTFDDSKSRRITAEEKLNVRF